MKADVWQFRLGQQLLQLMVGGTGVYGGLRAERIVKDPGGERGFLPCLQQLRCAERKDDFSRPGIGLGVPSRQPSALLFMEGAADLKRPGFRIEIRPHKPADLVQPEAGSQLGVEEVVPDGGCLDRVHEGIKLFLVQNVHGLAGDFRRFHLVGGIGGEESLLHRRPKHLVERSVDVVDGSAGKHVVLPGAGLQPAASLEGVVELPQIRRCHLGEHFRSQLGHNMVFHVFSIMLQCAGAEGGGYLPQPRLQPFREGHPALFSQIKALVEIDVLTELRGQLLLGVGIEVAEDGIAILLVPHHDAALPVAIFPLAHHAVAGWPALRHSQSPPVLISPSLGSMHSAMIRTPSRKPRMKFSRAVMLSISCRDSISFAKVACPASSIRSVSYFSNRATRSVVRLSSELGAMSCALGVILP